MQNNAKANISNLTFGAITGSEKSVGIAFEGNASLSGGITFTNTPSTALQIHSGAKASILGSIVFKNPQTSTSLIDNQGELDLLSSARLTFGTQPNDLENQIAEAGIWNVYDSGKIQLNLGNATIQTQAQNQTHQAYGIFTSSVTESEISLGKNKTLTFNVCQKNGNEGTAFGRGKDTQNNKLGAIHLTLSQNSNLIFNSNAGELDSLSGSNANISLVGNKSRISNSSLQLCSLSVEDFKLSDSTITLFASQEANISSNGFAEGKAYNQDKSQAQIAPTISAMLSNYTLYLANFNSLNKRMGELRDNHKEQGVWARVFGYRYDFSDAKGLYLTPSIELAFGYLNGTDFTQILTTPNQTQHTLYSHQDDIFITRGKIEATLGYFFATDFGMSTESVSEKGASLYLGLGYEYDYVSGGNIDYKVNQNSSSAQSSAIGPDGRMVLNLGSNILLNDTVRMYFDFEKNFFGKIDKEYQINAGIRIGLGEEKIPQPQKEEESAPLKIEE